jgi:hypothetical protein
MSRASRRARTAGLLLMAAVAAGCEYFRDTPEQELANRRWRECTANLRDIKLERVDTDGRIRFSYVALADRNRVVACLEAAGSDGRKLPEPMPLAQAGK